MAVDGYQLPGLLAEIADVAGFDAAMKVAAAVGGRRAYVSPNPRADGWLAQAVGMELAERIGAHFSTGHGGIELLFPIGPAGSYAKDCARRAHLIAKLAAGGATSTQIAREVRMSRRGVQRHRAAQRKKSASSKALRVLAHLNTGEEMR